MARVALTVQPAVVTGLNPTMTAATVDGHAFDNSSQKVYLFVRNGSGVSTTVTIDVAATVDGLAIADKTVTVPAGEDRLIGPFPQMPYTQVSTVPPITKAALVNAAPQTTVTYAAVRF